MKTLLSLTFMLALAVSALAQTPGLDRRRQAATPTGTPDQPDPRANTRFNPRGGMPIDPRTGRPIDPRSGAAPAIPIREDPALTAKVVGLWKGVYCSGVTVNLADLELKAAEGGHGMAGEVRFTSLADPRMRMVRPTEGSWRVEGKLDAGARTLTLIPKGWIKPPGGLLMQPPPQAMAVVYVEESQSLAGEFDSGTPSHGELPYFLFIRADGVGDPAGKIRALADHALAVMTMVRPTPAASAPDADTIVKWAGPYEQEYGASARTGGVGMIAAHALPLLNDANFKPVFGDGYDAIDPGTLLKAVQNLRSPGGLARALSPAELKIVRDYSYLEYVIRPSSAKVIAVAAMRVIDAWQIQMMARLSEEIASPSAFDDLASAQKAFKDRVPYAFPSDQKRAADAFEALRGKLAASTVTASVDRAIAEASGMNGAKLLAAWPTEHASMLRYATAAERETGLQKINRRLDELLQPLLAPLLAQLDKLGSGADAVHAGAAWHKTLLGQFDFAVNRPPVQQALARFTERRKRDLAEAQAQLLQRLAACKKADEVDALFANDLSLPGDDRSSAYAALVDARNKRKQKIAEEELLAMFSEEERAIMDRPGHLNVARAKPGPPSAEEIRLALLRGFAFGTGKMIDAHTCRNVSRSQSFLIPYPLIITISDEKRIDWAQVPNTNDYTCHYDVTIKIKIADDNMIANYDAKTRQGSQQMADMITKMTKIAGPMEQTFRLYDDGWGVPKLHEAGTKEAVLDLLGPRR